MALKVRVALAASAAGIPEVVIAGRARLEGRFPGTRILASAASRRAHRPVVPGPRGEEMTTALLPVYDRDLVLVKGKGARLWDENGREWLDFAAGIAVNGFGYGDKKIVAAIKKQAETLIHVSNYFHTRPGAALAERLVAARLPVQGVLHELGDRGARRRDEVRPPHRQGAGADRVRRLRALLPRPLDGRALADLDREVPDALRAADPRRPLRAARRPRGRRERRQREDGGRLRRAGAGRGRDPARLAGVPARPRRRSAARRARCSSSTRCSAASAGPGRCSPTSTRASCPTS